MTNLSRLSGTPWHVGTISKSDNRRHRNRCKYYNKDDHYCSKNFIKCCGSAHCIHYNETTQSENNLEKDVEEVIVIRPINVKNNKISQIYKNSGDKIKHKIFGLGEVIDFNGKTATIKFGTEIKKIDILVCLEKKLITIL